MSKHWRERYAGKVVPAQQALKNIKHGNRVFLGSACGEPQALVRAMCETGGARRSWLHGLLDLTKRYLMCAAGKNLGVLMRALFGVGKPRAPQAGCACVSASIVACIGRLAGLLRVSGVILLTPRGASGIQSR